MSTVLTEEQREQAGSDSYNRFEYQVHWIVCHIIGQIKEATECIIFCEFHDDMAEFSIEDQKYQFYQVKTKENKNDWTVVELSKKSKKKSGGYKKSFLGFIFYNFLKFGDECSCCHFVSNNDFDKDIREWQSYIEDNKSVQAENKELYQRIKERIQNEYTDDMPSDFDKVFDRFMQNTFIHESELKLSTYESQASGMFFKQLNDKNIPSNTANLIFQQLINDVRKKSKQKIRTPISFKSLVEKKGVVISEINNKINRSISKSDNFDGFFEYLQTQSLSVGKIKQLQAAKTLHDSRWLDINDIKYQEIVIVLRKNISKYIFSINEEVNIEDLKEQCIQELQNSNLYSNSLDTLLIEVLYYEQQFTQND